MVNGVKQGVVISTIHIRLYNELLLEEIKQSGVACHINNVYMGVCHMLIMEFAVTEYSWFELYVRSL